MEEQTFSPNLRRTAQHSSENGVQFGAPMLQEAPNLFNPNTQTSTYQANFQGGNNYNDHTHHHDNSSEHQELVNIDISGSSSINIGGLIERNRNKAREAMFEDEDDDKKSTFEYSRLFRLIWNDRDCKKLFSFILLLGSITLIEIFYGSYASSLGLISAAFHSSFDCIAMIISLAAMILAKHKPTHRFSYGYDRFEILSGFSNGTFLIFVCFFLLLESVERLVEPVEMENTELVTAVAFLALVVNMIGVVFFREYALIRSEARYAREENLHSVVAHLAIDGVGSVGVMVSTWLTAWGWLLADPIFAMGMVVLIIYNAIPICLRTGKVLLQTTPATIKDQLDKALREASTLEGVLECKNEHFWTQSPGVFVGSFCVRVRSDASEQSVLARVHNIFRPLIAHLAIQVEKDDFYANPN